MLVWTRQLDLVLYLCGEYQYPVQKYMAVSLCTSEGMNVHEVAIERMVFEEIFQVFLLAQSCEESFVPSQTLGSKELLVHPKVQHVMKETSRECTAHHCVQNKPPRSQGFQAVREPSRNTILRFHPGFPEMLRSFQTLQYELPR